jgi:hypothetical protein
MSKRLTRTLLCSLGLLYVLLCPIGIQNAAQNPASRQDNSAQQQPGSGENKRTVPLYSHPEYRPCLDQARSFRTLSESFAEGNLLSPSEMNGSWVLIGLWLHRDSRPDLDCAGISRGKTLEWVIFAQGYSLDVNAVGTYRQKLVLETRPEGNLTFAIDWEGDTNPVFRCRLSRRHRLVCLGSPYYERRWRSVARRRRLRRRPARRKYATRTNRSKPQVNDGRRLHAAKIEELVEEDAQGVAADFAGIEPVRAIEIAQRAAKQQRAVADKPRSLNSTRNGRVGSFGQK